MSSTGPDAKAAIAQLAPHLKALRSAAVAAHAEVSSPGRGVGGGGGSGGGGSVGALAGAALHIAVMKQASRAAYNASAAHLGRVSAAKERFEATSLRLQNLQYARDQLQREIQRCRDFPTTEMDAVEMVPEAEFRKNTGHKKAGDNNKKGQGPDDEAHQLTLLRLKHELELRKSLALKLGRLREQAKETDIATGLKTRFLADADDRLKALEDATLPLQRFFGLESTATDKRHLDAVSKLAGPLYVIYRQLDAYSQTVAEVATGAAAGDTGSRNYGKVTLTIVPALPFAGSHVSAAKDYAELPHPPALVTRQAGAGAAGGGSSSSSSSSSSHSDEGGGSRKRKRGSTEKKQDQDQNKTRKEDDEEDGAAEVAVFPHAILAKFAPLQGATRVRIRFQIVPALNVVTAEIEGEVKHIRGQGKKPKGGNKGSKKCAEEEGIEEEGAEEVDAERAFLGGMFRGDAGVEDGDYASERVQAAARVGIEARKKASTGRAYLWAQWLGGAKRLAGKEERERVRPSVPSIVEALLR